MAIIAAAATKAFEAESARTTYLQGKAEKLATLVAAVVGLQLLDFASVLQAGAQWATLPSWLSLWALLAALVLALLGMRVREYVLYPRGVELLDTLRSVTEDEGNESIAQMLLTARETNASLNDGRATILAWSGGLLVAGFVLAATARIMAVYQGGGR